MSSYTTHQQIMDGYAHHDELKKECESLSRVCAAELAAGATEEAVKHAREYVALDNRRFEFLMALSAATHKLCEVA